MTIPHTTLRPITNIILIFLWFILGAICFKGSGEPYILLILGLGFGTFAGIMQLLAFKEAKSEFLHPNTMMEVREVLKKTSWGKKYIYFLWSANIILVAIALYLPKSSMYTILVGYFSLMFIRELITLKATYELADLGKT
ncbi:MAG: hypothetical protein PHZ02_06935 [Desulfocapsaceae bacterium]|nr:hypothetical protein [Desulfocapsaceae bacterium]